MTDSQAIAGKHIVLVDDVLTTGATIRECARVLLDAGARNVMGVVLARTVHGSDLDTGELPDEPMPEPSMVVGYPAA